MWNDDSPQANKLIVEESLQFVREKMRLGGYWIRQPDGNLFNTLRRNHQSIFAIHRLFWVLLHLPDWLHCANPS
jgi:hypothetical protein